MLLSGHSGNVGLICGHLLVSHSVKAMRRNLKHRCRWWLDSTGKASATAQHIQAQRHSGTACRGLWFEAIPPNMPVKCHHMMHILYYIVTSHEWSCLQPTSKFCMLTPVTHTFFLLCIFPNKTVTHHSTDVMPGVKY